MYLRTLHIVLISAALAACTTSQQKTEASSGTSEKILQAYVDAWNSHDSAAFDTLLTSDGVHEDLAQAFVGHGAAEVKGFMREVLKMEPDFKWTLTKTFSSGDNIAAEWTWTSSYTGPSPNGPVTNLHISGRGASIVQMENGKIKHFTDYYDNASFFPAPAPADTTKKS